MSKIYLLRHGETLFNAENKLQGQCNSPLTRKGEQQAKNVGKKIKEDINNEQCLVYSSPLGRAVQTARIVCEEINYNRDDIILDQRLQEFYLGLWEQKNIPEIKERQPELTAKNDWYLSAPQAETYHSVKSRLQSWLQETSNCRKHIVAVSHALTGSVLRGLLTGMTYAEVWDQKTSQDAFYIYENGGLVKIDTVK